MMTVKIAISGAGYIGHIHAQAIQNAPGAEVAGLVDYDTAKCQTFSQRFGVSRCYSQVEDLLKDGGVDALVIGIPNAYHAPQTLAALEAGVAVMVEKPMAMDSAEAGRMLEVSEKKKVPLMVAHCWRFDEEVNWLKDQADSGALGKIIRTKGYGVHTNWGPSGWFTQKALAGGGAMADMGIHALDTARFVIGDPAPLSVYARIGTYYIQGDVDDTGVVMVNWDNGVTSYIETGWWQPHMDGPEAATQVYGTKGFAQIFPTRAEIPNPEAQRVDVIDPGYAYPRPEHCPQEMYDRQMAHFVECIETGKTPNPGGLEGLTNMEIVDAAYESARTGKVVYID
jgi:predicted dehydrogenase